MIWAIETKDGEPRFAHVKREVCETYFALLSGENKRKTKPEPVAYARVGQQEMFDVRDQSVHL